MAGALKEHPVVLVALTGLLVAAAFLLQGHLMLNLRDEGFLWYGTWRTTLGEVPLRDFQSYDPGRYYWGALFHPLFGDGVLALRASNAVFAALGLCCGVMALRRLDRNIGLLMLAVLLLLVWIYPRHKVFEPSLAMAATLAAIALIERPSLGRHFAAGVFVGVAACFGRNHGFYCLLALSLAGGFAWLKVDRRQLAPRLAAAAAGVTVGYLPILAMLVFVPGFAESFVESVEPFIRAGSTNLPRAVPWLWEIASEPPRYLAKEGSTGIRLAIVSVLYTLWPLFSIGALFAAVRRRGEITRPWAVLVGAVCVALPYFHFATSRAGISHLAQAIHPLLIALVAVPFVSNQSRSRGRIFAFATIALLGIASWLTIAPRHPLYRVAHASPERFVAYPVGGDTLRIRSKLAARLTVLQEMVLRHVGPDEPILIVPRDPTFYPLLSRKAPLREIYMTLPETPQRQAEMIDVLERDAIRFALICRASLDGRSEFAFRNTHPQLAGYLHREFERVAGAGRCVLRERRNAA